MTEEEAKTKWCPFGRAPILLITEGKPDAQAPVNRDCRGAPYEACNCIASMCMMWDSANGGCGLKLRG